MAVTLYAPEQYRTTAEALFGETARQIRAVFPDVQVEHMGSTAIPGALSKGDVDIAVLVPPGQLDHYLPPLLNLGFRVQDQTLRTPQLCMLKCLRADVDLALQVIERGSPFEFFLSFRDRLRSDPDLVSAYNQIKQAAQHLDNAAYRAAKATFIEQVLRETVPVSTDVRQARPSTPLDRIQIRPPHPDDPERISSLQALATAELRRIYRPRLCRQALSKTRTQPTILVAEVDRQLVGVVEWVAHPEAIWIQGLAVHPDYRQQGIARALLTDIEQQAEKSHKRRLVLRTIKETGNRPLFERLGFVVCQEQRSTGYEGPDGDAVTELTMVRPVGLRSRL